MTIFGNLNYDFDSIKQAIKDKLLLLDSDYVALYLYEKNDKGSYHMITTKGKEIQEKLKIDLFTYYNLSTFRSMGKFYGANRIERQFNELETRFLDESDVPFKKMKKIGDEYGVKKYPAIVFINPKATDVNSNDSYHLIEIDKSKFKLPDNLDEIMEYEADFIYRFFFEPFMDITASYYEDNKLFLDLKRRLNFSNAYEQIDNETKIFKKFSTYDKINNLKLYIQQQDRGCINRKGEKICSMDTFAMDALSINNDAYGRRFSRKIGFTRDELICLALYLGFSNAEFSKLIELYNEAFESCYPILNKLEKRDSIFLELMDRNMLYNQQDLNEELNKKGLTKIVLMNS